MSKHNNPVDLELKNKIVKELISEVETEIEKFSQDEKERLKAMDPEDGDTQDIVESPKEQMIGEIMMENKAIEHAQARLKSLKSIGLERTYEAVEPGALVYMNDNYFLVGISLQPTEAAGVKVVGVTTGSPIYQEMEGLEAGADFKLDTAPKAFHIASIV